MTGIPRYPRPGEGKPPPATQAAAPTSPRQPVERDVTRREVARWAAGVVGRSILIMWVFVALAAVIAGVNDMDPALGGGALLGLLFVGFYLIGEKGPRLRE